MSITYPVPLSNSSETFSADVTAASMDTMRITLDVIGYRKYSESPVSPSALWSDASSRRTVAAMETGSLQLWTDLPISNLVTIPRRPNASLDIAITLHEKVLEIVTGPDPASRQPRGHNPPHEHPAPLFPDRLHDGGVPVH